ncbi:uncharacterized protein LOC120348870 [Nilaparvata lugens]|uniref:uncharacterized protein LOC120348870 n=1 Tax=Nilaparvata lugens TaxID=108931 RepID=UPI00193DE46D|nr:uncharacterized protein LOC120348870 [Nilaparvata lugens]
MTCAYGSRYLNLGEQKPFDLRLFVNVSIGDLRYEALLDTGAKETRINSQVVQDLEMKGLIHYLPQSHVTVMPNGMVGREESKVVTYGVMNECELRLIALVTDCLEYDLILGMPFLVEHKVIIHNHTRTVMWEPNTVEIPAQYSWLICGTVNQTPKEVNIQPRTSSQLSINSGMRSPTSSISTNRSPTPKVYYQRTTPGQRRRAGKPRIRVICENGKKAWKTVDRPKPASFK